MSDLISPSCSLRVTLRSMVGSSLVFTLALPVSVQHIMVKPMQTIANMNGKTSKSNPVASSFDAHQYAPQKKMQAIANKVTIVLTMIRDTILF